MSSYSKFARIAIPMFTAAVLAALSIQPPAGASPRGPAAARLASVASKAGMTSAVEEILMGYATVLIRNGQAGSVARDALTRLDSTPALNRLAVRVERPACAQRRRAQPRGLAQPGTAVRSLLAEQDCV